MKKLQRLCVATVFTLVLTTASLAGEIHTPGIAQPTPTPTPASSSAMATGEIPIGGSSGTSEVDVYESNLLTDIALDLLQIMLSVF
jgi:hypothetical protein